MRLIIIFLLSGFIQSVMAINKCEINGKVSYQQSPCPVNASSKSLVKDKYISEKQMHLYAQEAKRKSDESFKKINSAKTSRSIAPDSTEIETKSVSPKQIENLYSETESVDAEQQATDKNNPPKVNVPGAFEYVNPKLSDMDRKLNQHNKNIRQNIKE